jgi:hypothetical protein
MDSRLVLPAGGDPVTSRARCWWQIVAQLWKETTGMNDSRPKIDAVN